jgi:predicted nucleic acid-binding protein
MSGGSFVDTNIWVYAHLEDAQDPRCATAWDFIRGRTDAVISAQVTAEYFNVMRRNAQDEARIERNITRMLRQCRVQSMDSNLVRRTLGVRKHYGFSIWDSQVVAAALEAGCDTLYTEDLQHGQVIDSITIIDPLRG